MNQVTARDLIERTLEGGIQTVPALAVVDERTVRVEIRILDTTELRFVGSAVPLVSFSQAFRLNEPEDGAE